VSEREREKEREGKGGILLATGLYADYAVDVILANTRSK